MRLNPLDVDKILDLLKELVLPNTAESYANVFVWFANGMSRVSHLMSSCATNSLCREKHVWRPQNGLCTPLLGAAKDTGDTWSQYN